MARDETWGIYVGRSYTKKNGGAGVVLITPKREKLCSSLRLELKTIVVTMHNNDE